MSLKRSHGHGVLPFGGETTFFVFRKGNGRLVPPRSARQVSAARRGQSGLRIAGAKPLAALTVGFQAMRNLAAPLRFDGEIAFDGRRALGDSVDCGGFYFRHAEERVAEDAPLGIHVIDRAALCAGLNHRPVLRCELSGEGRRKFYQRWACPNGQCGHLYSIGQPDAGRGVLFRRAGIASGDARRALRRVAPLRGAC